MIKKLLLLLCSTFFCMELTAQSPLYFYGIPRAWVNFEGFQDLMTQQVKSHRATRLVNFDQFLAMSQEPNTIILDTRSETMFRAKHLKGAIHLEFTNFNIGTLRQMIPDKNTRILIYGNTNIAYDPNFFPEQQSDSMTLPLTIPTYINLYGYGFKNVFELSELMSQFDPRIEFEGLAALPNDKRLPKPAFKPAPVDFDAYEKLVAEVKRHRVKRLIYFEKFLAMSREENVVIFDTRSDVMYKLSHVDGAIHLCFQDFTAFNLEQMIPDKNTKILIYCNNNFKYKPIEMAGKMLPRPESLIPNPPPLPNPNSEALTLALNIPTYIHLYGYGYKNVYELTELMTVDRDSRLKLVRDETDILIQETKRILLPRLLGMPPAIQLSSGVMVEGF